MEYRTEGGLPLKSTKTCTRCTRDLRDDERVFSAWTRSYYCRDIDRCDKRRKRLGLSAAAQIASRLNEVARA
jgi:hypothetical protein